MCVCVCVCVCVEYCLLRLAFPRGFSCVLFMYTVVLIINFWVFFISLLLYHSKATGFSHTIVCSALPDTEKNQLPTAYFRAQIVSCRTVQFVAVYSCMHASLSLAKNCFIVS